MGSTAIDGLISGLDTTTIITQLMQLEAAPQTVLKTKVTTSNSFVAALQSLNAKLSSLADSAKTAATAASWQAVTASSSATSVTATTGATAQPSSLTFSVAGLATAQTSLSGAITTAAPISNYFGGTVPATLTLATGSGATASVKSIDLAGVTDLAGLASAVNKSDTGVTASIVQISATESRLQLTAKATGGVAAFDLYSGAVTTAEIAGGTAPAPVLGRTTTASNTVITAASDASITLWKGIAGAEQTVTSASNTFTGVITGVNFTITKAEVDPVTVTIGRNDSALKSMASGLVANLGVVLSEIAAQTKSTTTTTDGRAVTKGGVLSSDSAVRGAQQSVVTAASDPVDGISPSTMGIVLAKDGTFTFDADKFAAALAADPAKVQAVISGVAARVQTVAEGLSNKSTGMITLKIQGQQSYVKSLGDQVISWDSRLEMRRAALEKQYAALEVALGKLGSQSDWLTSQLDSMNSSS